MAHWEDVVEQEQHVKCLKTHGRSIVSHDLDQRGLSTRVQRTTKYGGMRTSRAHDCRMTVRCVITNKRGEVPQIDSYHDGGVTRLQQPIQ